MEVKELLDALDIQVDEGAELDAVKDKFHAKYVARDIAPNDDDIKGAVLGKHLATLERNLKKQFTDAFGLDGEALADFSVKAFEQADAETNPIYRAKHKYETEIAELREKGGKANNKKADELQEKLDKATRDIDSYKTMLEEKDNELETVKSEAEAKHRNWIINQRKSDVLAKFQMSDTVDDYKRRGFEAVFNEKYKLDLEDDEVVVLDKDGKRVPNSKKSGNATLEDVYKMELEAANMLKKNNAKTDRQTYKRERRDDGGGQGVGTNAMGRINRAEGMLDRYANQGE